MPIEPTSDIQFKAARGRLIVPPLELVSDGVWALGMPMPDGGYIGYSLCYLLLDARHRVHVIDPGWDLPGNRAVLRGALAGIGQGATIATITVTHLHPDHSGLAGYLRELSGGAPVIMHEREQQVIASLSRAWGSPTLNSDLDGWGVPEQFRAEIMGVAARTGEAGIASPDILVGHGNVLAIDGFSLRVLHTPGHTDGSICLREEKRGLIFTGDHIVPTLHPGLGLGTTGESNPLHEYLVSLEMLLEFDRDEVLPGHGYRFRGLAARATASARHHLRRTAEVDEALRANAGLTIWQLAENLTWTAGWDNLRHYFLVSALRQTSMHVRLIRSGGLPEMADKWANS